MKEFNLKEALAGKPIVMRNGTKIKAVYYIKEAEPQKVLAVIETENEKVQWCNEDGSFKYCTDEKRESDYDLFMDDSPKTYFMNIYKGENGVLYSGSVLYTEELASVQGRNKIGHFKTIEISI